MGWDRLTGNEEQIVKDAQVMGMKCRQMGGAGSMERGVTVKGHLVEGGEGKQNDRVRL